MISINFNEEGKKILIVGGGKQALIKGEKFPGCIYLSPSFIDEIPEEQRILKVYEKEDVAGYFLVIAATNNKDLNHQIVMDCNENNILSASINMDDQSSVHFQKEMDFPYLHVAFTTKSTCPGYHEVLEKEFESLYQRHEPVLEDLKVIREYAIQAISKYAQRNEFLINVVQKDPQFIHTLKEALEKNECKVLCFHSQRSEENEAILNNLVKRFEIPCFYCFNHELEEVKTILTTLNLEADYITITVRPGKASEQVSNQCEQTTRVINFTDNELSSMMRSAHYTYYIYHPMTTDTLKHKLARSYAVFNFNDELPDYPGTACICLLLKGTHYYKEIKNMIESNPEIEFDPRCLLEQEFFIQRLLEKIG